MTEQRFEDYKLGDEILRAIHGLGYSNPTDVQTQVIPVALNKQDLVVKSQTGSGKTASYGIPLCEMVDWKENKPQVLILTPTRELAVQVNEDMTNIGRFKRIKSTAVYGRQRFSIQRDELRQKTHVVVGTPGRVLDHIGRGTIALERIEYLVIDEADEMLNMGFIEQVEAIIRELPAERMTMLFSATLPSDVEKLSRKYMSNPVEIEIKASGITTATIEHVLYAVKDADKFRLLRDITLVENPDSCIIFCRTQEQVNQLFQQLAELEYPCDKLHGGMEQDERFEVMNAFRRGQFRYLIATDVAARGIDIKNISHVINYDIPMDKESYVHRTGRTGRAGQNGMAITFVTPKEGRFLADIEGYIGFSLPRKHAPSAEEVFQATAAFQEKLNIQPAPSESKSEQLNKEIMKLNFNGGKKQKLRAVDFVGTIARIKDVSAEDIGIITILDNASYVEILNGKGQHVLEVMEHTTIKAKMWRVRKANK